MERIVERTLLFDFYGELMTEHQRRIYEAVVLNDTGYSEVAACEGISRQGVHDLIRRCDRQLNEYEEKLKLVERFLKIRSASNQIIKLTQEWDTKTPGRIRTLAEQILEEL